MRPADSLGFSVRVRFRTVVSVERMHKYRRSKRHRIYNRRHARKLHRRELDWKISRRKRDRLLNSLSRQRRVEWNRIRSQTEHRTKSIEAPSTMSFIGNPVGMVRFIGALQRAFDHRWAVYVQLQGVERIDYDAITVLLSVMVRFKAAKIQFNGNKPLNRAAKQTIEQSNFFEHLYKTHFVEQDRYDLKGKGVISTHAYRTVDSERIQKYIDKASKAVWGERRRCPGVYRALIELMQNTTNHASPKKEGDKHWWLSVNHDASRDVVSFTFVDYGIGVFKSLDGKDEGHRFYEKWMYLCKKLWPDDDSKLLKAILEGELHRTKTGEPFRGKGLPGIYRAFKRNQFSSFAMVTNNVYFNSNADEYRLLKVPFSGTFVYWELHAGNTSIDSAT